MQCLMVGALWFSTLIATRGFTATPKATPVSTPSASPTPSPPSATATATFIPDILITIAGTGYSYSISGDGGPGTSSQLGRPYEIAVDTAGNVYLADSDNQRVRKWTASTGIINTIVGGGSDFGDGGAGTSAQLSQPSGVAVDTAGNVYIADFVTERVRKWTASTGIINTIVGTGVWGLSGDGGAGTSAQLNDPWGVAVDSAGNVYIADTDNVRVRMLICSAAVVLPWVTITPAPTPSSSPTPYCWPALYTALPRMDIAGTLVGSALYPGSDFLAATEAACQQSCCDAPACDAYAFAVGNLGLLSAPGAQCYLYVNVTALVPSSGYTSGALLSVYS